jgi:hypothetical protein
MLVKSLATVVLLIAGLWATFRPLHPTEHQSKRIGREPELMRLGTFLFTMMLIILVWTWR